MWLAHGGYLIVRKSKHGFWLHFMWAKKLNDAEVKHFVPLKKLRYPLITKILFKGSVKDGEYTKEN